MTKNVQLRALQAAARVAMVSTLLGVVACDPSDTDTGSDTSDAVTDSGIDCTGDTVDTTSCEEQVASDFLNDTVDEDTADCCQEIAEGYDAVKLKGMDDWAERHDCCELLGWDGSMACTPWGPPAPPTMRDEVA